MQLSNRATGLHCSQTAFGGSEQPPGASGVVKAGQALQLPGEQPHRPSRASLRLRSRSCLSLVQGSVQSNDLEKQFCWSISVRTEITEEHVLVRRMQKSHPTGKDHGLVISFVFYSLISTATAMQPISSFYLQFSTTFTFNIKNAQWQSIYQSFDLAKNFKAITDLLH